LNNAAAIGFEFVQALSAELSKGSVQLPAFPDVTLRIKKILEDPEVSAKQIAAVVSADPVFSARILNIANSAAMGASKSVTDIPSAITRIGFKMAHNVAVSVAVNQIVSSDLSAQHKLIFDDLWLHSISVAAHSYVIARKIKKINADKALLAGLMHDIGKIYIVSRAAETYPHLIDDIQALNVILTDWHTGVGSAILKNWDMDDELLLVADEHELYNRETHGHNNPADGKDQADLTDVVLAANLIAQSDSQLQSLARPAEEDWFDLGAFKRLEINEDTLVTIREESREEIDSIISALGGS
jgi:putative nucleotidyltransferase with HDIG domain